MNNFPTDQFNKVKEIREECRHTEYPKEIYGILSVLLHEFAGKIVNIDDLGAITEDLYPLLLKIAAECQYGCEQLELIAPQLEQEQIEDKNIKKLEVYHKTLKEIYDDLKTTPLYETIQKDKPPIRYYKINDTTISNVSKLINNYQQKEV